MHEFRDIVIAYGESDEYSFVLRRSTELYGAGCRSLCSAFGPHHMLICPYCHSTAVILHVIGAGRRASKLVSLICSCFTGNYVRGWPEHMSDTPLQTTPVFDARAVLYPSDRSLRDYLSWRQADTHINNQVGIIGSVGGGGARAGAGIAGSIGCLS